MKKIICFLLALVMTLAAVPVFAATVYTYYCEDGLTAKVDVAAKILTLSGEGDMMDYTSDNRPPWYERKSLYTKVIIEEGITSIGDYAFADNLVLVSAEVPESVTSVGNYGFHHCIKLAEMHFSQNVTEIGEYALADCNSLKSVTLPKTLTEIPRALFRCTYFIENLVMPEDCPSIGAQAFMSCSYLKNIDLPDNLRYIGNYAFNGCNALTAITIPSGTEYIGDFAFYQLTKLKEINIPKTVNFVGEDAFCSTPWYNALSNGFNLVNGITITFKGDTTTKSLKIPEGAVAVAPGACGSAIYATEVIIPSSVKTLCDYAFYGLSSLYSVTVPNGVETIGDYALGYYASTSGAPTPMYPFTIYSSNPAAKEYAAVNKFDFVCLHNNYTLENYPDCTEGGTADKVCLCCGEIIGKEEISAGNHSYETKIFAETCTENGFTKDVCTVCGYERIIATAPAKGHTAESGFKIKEATCAESGLIYKLCADCGERFDEVEIEKLPHTSSDTQTVTKDPTCTEDGEYAVLCRDCGEVLETGNIEAEGHTKSKKFTILNQPSFRDKIKGLYVRECSKCHIALDYGEFYKGDLNGDNRLNSRDTMTLKKALINSGASDADEREKISFLGDMNDDGRVNSRDTMSLKRLINNS